MAIHNRYREVVTILLRSLTLSARFLFIFFLAKYLEPENLGYYGLFAATVGFSVLFVGLDYYTYVTRELIRLPHHKRGHLLKGQIYLSGLLYISFLPLAGIAVSFSDWPDSLLWWFVPILALEHLNQEMYRLLIAMSKQVSANIALFLRQGLWVLAVIVLMGVAAEYRTLSVVFTAWGLSGIAAATFGYWQLRKLNFGGWDAPVAWNAVRKGIQISTLLLVATLALRAVQTFDRYIIEAWGSVDVLGAYVLFISVAGALIVFLDAGVFSFAYPRLIAYHNAGDTKATQNTLYACLWKTIVLCIMFSIASIWALPALLSWIGTPTYLEMSQLYKWLLCAAVLNALSLVPHYGLYSRGQDKPIVYSHIAGLIVFIGATFELKQCCSLQAIPIALNIVFGTLLVWKSSALFWHFYKDRKDASLNT